jgi:hypothetical protein
MSEKHNICPYLIFCEKLGQSNFEAHSVSSMQYTKRFNLQRTLEHRFNLGIASCNLELTTGSARVDIKRNSFSSMVAVGVDPPHREPAVQYAFRCHSVSDFSCNYAVRNPGRISCATASRICFVVLSNVLSYFEGKSRLIYRKLWSYG